MSLVLAYGAYLVADALGGSGIIAVTTAGVDPRLVRPPARPEPEGRRSRSTWSGSSWRSWRTALIFLLVGLAIDIQVLGRVDSLPIAWAVVAILLARALVVYVLLGGAARLAGRGRPSLGPAAGLAARPVLGRPARSRLGRVWSCRCRATCPTASLIGAIAFGVVLFTLLVQGSTASLVIGRALASTEEPGPVVAGS